MQTWRQQETESRERLITQTTAERNAESRAKMSKFGKIHNAWLMHGAQGF